MRDYRFLVTGGAGHIGSSLVDRLIKEGVREIVVVDNLLRGRIENLEGALKSGKVKFLVGDIRDINLIKKIMPEIDYVFHTAVLRVSYAQLYPKLCREVMVDATANLIHEASKHKIKKFIFCSSATVYGEPDYVPTDENHPLKSQVPYGLAKIATEKALRDNYEKTGLNYSILRLFNVYGPRMDFFSPYTEVISKWINNIRQKKPVVIHGDGQNIFDFTFIDDTIEAHIKALSPKASNKIFNIGTGKETSLIRLANLLLKITGSSCPIVFRASPRKHIITRRCADTKFAYKELGFGAKIMLEEGLKKTIL